MTKQSLSGPTVVVLTGAGISAESGVPTFRGADGLWQGSRIEDVATATAVAYNRPTVNAFFNARRAEAKLVHPNPAHMALAALERALGPRFLLITQNIDDLHEKAGSQNPIHMHGEIFRAACDACGNDQPIFGDITDQTPCPVCGVRGRLRPDIVLFGEMPKQMDVIAAALMGCRLFVAVGTSGVVYPAAGFVDYARQAGAATIEVNLADTERSPAFDEKIVGPAGVVLPPLIQGWIQRFGEKGTSVGDA